jgi:hypothetical protein
VAKKASLAKPVDLEVAEGAEVTEDQFPAEVRMELNYTLAKPATRFCHAMHHLGKCQGMYR